MGKSWMKPSESMSGKEGTVHATLGGRRYNFGHITQFEGTVDVKKSEVPTLGNKMTGHKITGMTGKFKGKLYFMESEARKLWLAWKNGEGNAPVFEIVVANEDTSTSNGRQTVVYKDCMSDSFVLSKLDLSTDNLDEDIEGTFDDFEMPETFSVPAGLEE